MTVPRLAGLLNAASDPTGPPVLVTATDGNHGRAVARMAALLGLAARIHVPAVLGAAALEGIRGEGASVVVEEAVYDDVVLRAASSVLGSSNEVLVQDTAWEGFTQVPQWIVDGCMTLFVEIDDAFAEVVGEGGPDLVACPVGVGSLAQALVEHYRSRPLDAGHRGAPVLLAAGMDACMGITDDECLAALEDLRALGQDAGPCGAAALAGTRSALADPARRRELGITGASVVVLVNTEGRAANPLV